MTAESAVSWGSIHQDIARFIPAALSCKIKLQTSFFINEFRISHLFIPSKSASTVQSAEPVAKKHFFISAYKPQVYWSIKLARALRVIDTLRADILKRTRKRLRIQFVPNYARWWQFMVVYYAFCVCRPLTLLFFIRVPNLAEPRPQLSIGNIWLWLNKDGGWTKV